MNSYRGPNDLQVQLLSITLEYILIITINLNVDLVTPAYGLFIFFDLSLRWLFIGIINTLHIMIHFSFFFRLFIIVNGLMLIIRGEILIFLCRDCLFLIDEHGCSFLLLLMNRDSGTHHMKVYIDLVWIVTAANVTDFILIVPFLFAVRVKDWL